MPKATAAPRFLRVEHDAEGLRLAILELLEESFQRGKIQGSSTMAPATRDKHLAAITDKRTLAAGYYAWASHLFRLDAEREAGLPLDPHTLAAFEGTGLRTLAACRNEHRAKHPPCSRCGTPQENRFHPECTHCGAKFVRKGKQ